MRSDAALARLSEVLGGPEHRALRLAFVEWIRQSLTPGRGTAKVPRLKSRLKEIAELGEFEEMKSFMLKSMEDHWLGQGVTVGMERGVTMGMERARADERELLCRQARRKFGGRGASAGAWSRGPPCPSSRTLLPDTQTSRLTHDRTVSARRCRRSGSTPHEGSPQGDRRAATIASGSLIMRL